MVEKTFNSYQSNNNEMEKGSTRFLGSKAVAILNRWFVENNDYPYPNENTTDWLAKQAGNFKEKIFYFDMIKNCINLILYFKVFHRNKSKSGLLINGFGLNYAASQIKKLGIQLKYVNKFILSFFC